MLQIHTYPELPDQNWFLFNIQALKKKNKNEKIFVMQPKTNFTKLPLIYLQGIIKQKSEWITAVSHK